MSEPFIFDEQYTNINDSIPYIRWKGKVFSQISSIVQPTQDTNANLEQNLLMKPRPIKHAYRREIAVNTLHNGNALTTGSVRISSSIDVLNQPGGSLIYANGITNTAVSSCDGLVQTLDPTLPNNSGELGYSCTTCNLPTQCVSTSTNSSNACFSPQLDARRRVRSAGMIKKKFIESKNNDNAYFTDNRQYLVSRNRTIEQNDYRYLRQGNPTVTPGTTASKSNIYSPAGLSHCRLTAITASLQNNVFQYVWVDGNTYVATIPDSHSYDINSFNDAFQLIMINNGHYYLNNFNRSNNFLLVFSYNTLYGKIEIQSISATQFYNSNYSQPVGSTWTVVQPVPQIHVLSNGLTSALGINAGFYPTSATNTTSQTIIASSVGSLQPPYVALIYKPSNPQFGCQGGVDAGSLIARKKYDAITNNGFAYRMALGSGVADAMAYGVSIPGYNVYTLKDKIGYPLKLIPKFPKVALGSAQNDTLTKCVPKRFSNLY